MNRVQRAQAEEYLEACCQILRLPKVHLSRISAPSATGDPEAIAACGLDTRRRPAIHLSEAWWKAAPEFKRDYLAHELIHVAYLNTGRLVDGWERRGLITERQLDEFTKREEGFVYHFQHLVAALLPEWPY